MSDTSPAIPESIDPANQHKALTAGQQAVIKKLFRRLIVFLFVLFIFSFLDRINIGFAGLTMGRDLGLSATMFGLATTLVLCRLCHLRHSQQHYAEYCRCAALDRHHHGALGHRLYCHHVCHWPHQLVRTAYTGWHYRSRLSAWYSAVFNLLVSGLFPRPCQRLVYGSNAGNDSVGLDRFRLHFVAGWRHGIKKAGSGCFCWKASRRYYSASWCGSGLMTHRTKLSG